MLCPEIGLLHFKVPPPLKVPEVHFLVLVQEQQVIGQLLGRGEVVHVDEGVSLDKVLVVLPGRAQNHWDCPHRERVVQFFSNVVLVDGVLKSQVELAAGNGGEIILVRDVLPEGLSIRVNLNVFVQLIVVFDPHVVLVPVAHNPADQLVFAGWDKVLLTLRCYDRPIRHFNVSILTVIESQIEQVLDPRQLGGVRRRLQVHPYPLLEGWSLERRQVGQVSADVSVMDDDPIRLVVEVSVRCDETALDVEERAAHAQVVGLSEGPEPDQHGGHVFIVLDGEEVLDPVCGYC